ncbi:hypothetical protein TCAL_10353 [Tigriopus californicus]|uniref:Vesicle-associated membrane protein 7 n=1 Tax=Tigriopus californicus TaxID=6832 RepID=A0A553NCI1_TIGCA|nr:vesicle-associated membrane protein 7-like [Tigriopus californicus]TRY63150.1 hypothetical protein TCAL_10353 [Tigriopus californicus]|eukprot:TCALIF_10353-PA protein Name:"Similar to VAMP7 Vesicle-associated membrane protein 7 (Gallus gallus)" AED:0.01 eAED:0.01 QI:0/-1/0/1/-1/1/1/0/228
MSVLFCAVSQGSCILARHAVCLGNFSEVTDKAMVKIQAQSAQKQTFQDGSYCYHYIKTLRFIYFCISEPNCNRIQAFQFLNVIQEKFERSYGSTPTTSHPIPFAMNGEFSPILSREMKALNDQMSSRNEDDSQDKLSRAQSEIQSVKDILVSNIDLVAERGERMEVLIDKTENLRSESISFRQRSRTLQRKMWWESLKMKIVLGVVFVLILYLIIAASCDGPLLPKCV